LWFIFVVDRFDWTAINGF